VESKEVQARSLIEEGLYFQPLVGGGSDARGVVTGALAAGVEEHAHPERSILLVAEPESAARNIRSTPKFQTEHLGAVTVAQRGSLNGFECPTGRLAKRDYP